MCNDDGLPVQYFFFAWVTSTLLDLEKALAAVVALVAPVSNKGENSLRSCLELSGASSVSLFRPSLQRGLCAHQCGLVIHLKQSREEKLSRRMRLRLGTQS